MRRGQWQTAKHGYRRTRLSWTTTFETVFTDQSAWRFGSGEFFINLDGDKMSQRKKKINFLVGK